MDATSVLSWLRGGSQPETKTTLAPPLVNYPTKADAEYAQDYGYGYGSGNEPFLNSEQARIVGQWTNIPPPPKSKKVPKGMVLQQFNPLSASGMDTSTAATLATDPNRSSMINLNQPGSEQLKQLMDQRFMQAALAANRIPIAGIGFDPNRVAIDTVMKNPNIAGLYSREGDAIYSALNPYDAIVHESTHRGLNLLRNRYPEETKAALAKSPDEEMIVRWLMQKQAGDPEKLYPGDVGERQRQEARALYEGQAFGPERQKALNDLQELAIRYRKEMRPGGPR